MRISSLLNTATALAIATVLWVIPEASGQRLYSLGGASVLQEIDIDDRSVEDLVTITPSLSDIAFHPDGTLYGVNERTIYRVNISDGSTEEVATLPASYGWLVGLTIDYLGKFYISSLASGSDHILKYDIISGNLQDLGKVGYSHWDLEFYKGKLYLSGGTDEINKGLLIEADLDDLTNSQVILDYETQAYGLSSFNDACTGHELVAAVRDSITFLYPGSSDFDKLAVTDPQYSTSSGTASRTSYLGSVPPFEIALQTEGPAPCDTGELFTLRAESMNSRPGIEFSLDGVNFQTSTMFPDLEMGTYTVTVRDSFGCRFETGAITVMPFEPELEILETPANCSKDNGTITINAEYSSPLQYSIDGNTWLEIGYFDLLAPGDYSVIVQSQAGCEKAIDVTIPEIPQLTHAFATTPEHCAMGDATIAVTAEGGQGPYAYSLVALPDQSSPLFTELHAGTYAVRTSDALGCKVQDLVDIDMINGPQIVEVATQDAHCGFSDGSAVVSASGGTGTLTYTVNGVTSSDGGFSSLGEGVYSVYVTDAAGCVTEGTFTISALEGPSILDVVITNDNCNTPAGSIEISAEGNSGLKYAINGGTYGAQALYTDLPAGQYEVAVIDEFGCEAFEMITLEMDDPPQILDVAITPATCGEDNGSASFSASGTGVLTFSLNDGIGGQSAAFSGLQAGDFVVHVTDNNDCSTESEFTIEAIDPVYIESVETTDVSCLGEDGTIRITLTDIDAGATFALNGMEVNGPFITGISADEYTVTSVDSYGCTDTAITLIGNIPGIIINDIDITHSTCGETDGEIALDAENVTEMFIQGLQDESGPVFTNLSHDMYQLVLLGNGHCRLDTVIEIKTIGCDVYVPNVFSPNGDGTNELLKPSYDPTEVSVTAFDIFDRWGNRIFSCNDQCAWDGRDHGEPVPAGVYVYYISSEDVYGNVNRQSGDITILR